MTTVFIVLIAAAVFVLGQRYFARFMAATAFADPDPDTAQAAPVWAGAARHAAAVAGGTTVAGTAMGAVWGWSPAFLWIVVGTVVVAGTSVMGARWLSLKAGGRSIAEIAAGLIGMRGALVFAAASLLFLTAVNAVAAVTLGRLLAAQPAAAFALWLQIPLALLLARPLARGGTLALAAGVLAVLAAFVPVLMGARWAPLELDGSIVASIDGTPALRLDPALVWTLTALGYALVALRRPPASLILPRGVIAAGGGALVVALTVFAVVVAQPDIAAPEINREAQLPASLPWLLLVLTGGAAGALHGLIAASGPPAPGEPAPAGYGAALAVGALATAALVACTAGTALPETWRSTYASWEHVIHPSQMLDVFLAGFAHLAGYLGIDRAFAADLGALALAGLALATLETGLRLQHRLLDELLPEAPARSHRGRSLAWIAVVLIAAAALAGRHAGSGELVWPLFGAASHLVAAAVLGIVALAVIRLGRPVGGVLVPLAAVAAGLAWGLVAMIVHGAHTGNVAWTAAAVVLLAAEGWLAAEGIISLRRHTAAANGQPKTG